MKRVKSDSSSATESTHETSTDNRRPNEIYIVEHEYTCSHLYDAEKTTDRKGVYYDASNAVTRAVQVVADELAIDLHDKKVMMEFLACSHIKDAKELDDPQVRFNCLFDILTGGVSEEIETEGVDEHTVTIQVVQVEDAEDIA